MSRSSTASVGLVARAMIAGRTTEEGITTTSVVNTWRRSPFANISVVMTQALRAARDQILIRRSCGTSPSGLPLPPLAFRMGGEHFRSDAAFVSSAVRDVDRLRSLTDLNENSRLLDWGCGAGRLAIGVTETFGRIRGYHGVDVQRHLIDWANRHLAGLDGIDFTHVNVSNARYNPSGAPTQSIPGASNEYDVFYAYSVFSHLNAVDAASYMKEVARLIQPNGAAFITAFVEDDVPSVEENPLGYGPSSPAGPLHCVRFERGFFENMVISSGLTVDVMTPGQETDGQSLYILRKPADTDSSF